MKFLSKFKKKMSDLLFGTVQIKDFDYFNDGKINKVISFNPDSDGDIKYNIYSLDKARIIQSEHTSLGVLKKNFLINELSFQSQDLIRKNINYNKILKKGLISYKTKKLKGASLCLLQDISQKRNYFHFIYDLISKILLLELMDKKIHYDYLLFPKTTENYQRDIIDAFSLDKSKIIDCDGINSLEVERLYIVEHPYWKENSSWDSDCKKIPSWIIKNLKRKFVTSKIKSLKNKKIFIDRSDSTYLFNQIENLDEVKSILKKYDFDILQLTKFPFLDQVSLFNDANFVIGAHGAGFANLAFCESGTKVLEFRHKNYDFGLYERIAKVNNLEYESWLTNLDNNFQIVVNINKLINYLESNLKKE